MADPDGIVTIASNQFTLGAGNYLIRWQCPAVQVERHQTRFFDVTGAAAFGSGSSERSTKAMTGYPAETNRVTNKSFGAQRVTPVASNTYRIEHYCTNTISGFGFGIAANFGRPEIYTIIEIFKEA